MPPSTRRLYSRSRDAVIRVDDAAGNVIETHDHGRMIIALQGGTMRIEDQSGTSETHVWETGKAYWLLANPPNTMHRDINVGGHPIEVMVVEVEDHK